MFTLLLWLFWVGRSRRWYGSLFLGPPLESTDTTCKCRKSERRLNVSLVWESSWGLTVTTKVGRESFEVYKGPVPLPSSPVPPCLLSTVLSQTVL